MNKETLKQQLADKWGSRLCYLECGEGWTKIISQLDEAIVKIAPDYQVMQVKEKMGGLRYYIGAVSGELYDQVHALIGEAEQLAAETCELCGEPGQMCRRGGWLKTLCKDCFSEWIEGDEINTEYGFDPNSE